MSATFNKPISPLRLLRFAFPSVVMMMILSLYSIIDGLFVANFVSTDALGSINIAYPIISIGLGISIMLAAGGSAIIGKKLGEGDTKKANEVFSFLIFITIFVATLFLIGGNIFINPLVKLLGATEIQFEMTKSYLRIHLLFIVFFYLQNAFQVLFATAGKPNLGLLTTLLAGITNILLDYLFIVVLKMGISGAALGTGLSYLIPAITGLCYFSFSKKGNLHFAKFRFSFKVLKEATFNGSSEMLTNCANAITTFLFNYQFLKYYQEDGVAAITIVLYFQFLIAAAFFGYSQGIAPIISYKYGMKNAKELKTIRKYSLITTCILGVVGFSISFGLIYPVASLFSGGNTNVYSIVVNHYWLYSFVLLIMGIPIFASAWFTALGDGLSSAIISFLRTLVFLSLSIMLVPMLLGEAGLWLSTTIAEILGLITAVLFLVCKNKRLKELPTLAIT